MTRKSRLGTYERRSRDTSHEYSAPQRNSETGATNDPSQPQSYKPTLRYTLCAQPEVGGQDVLLHEEMLTLV